MIDAEPNTKLECAIPPETISDKSMYRDAALEAIVNFCEAQDGKTVIKGNDDSSIKETAFTVSYASTCQGSGTYKLDQDLCKKYLMQTLDGCDTDSRVYKHGGILTDTDNCGTFEFHPQGFDTFACYPDNKDRGYISEGRHITISPAIAEDAINQFCDRAGNDQTFTLDPANNVDPTTFSGDTCKGAGLASCGYFYSNDGQRVTETGSTGDISIRMNARYFDPGNGFACSPSQVYDISGDRYVPLIWRSLRPSYTDCHANRCKGNLRKVMGVEPKGQCVGSDPSKLDLGSFMESGDKGCVLWNMYAVATH